MALQQWRCEQMERVFYSTFYLSLSIFISVFLFFKLARRSKPKTNLNLPPSPPKIPFIGNLHQFGTLPHRALRDLSLKYGDIMMLQLGQMQTPTLVVSSVDLVTEIIKTHDLAFSDRPQNTAANILLYGCTNFAFALYGENWRQKRKICAVELLSTKKVQSFGAIREEEVAQLVKKVREASWSGENVVNLSEMIMSTSNNIVCKCALGMKFAGDGYRRVKELSREVMIHLTAFTDMFVGGTDTTSSAIEWTMSELLRNPVIMKKVQEEVRAVVGDKSNVEESDIKKMHYLKCVIKESLRLHPPAPLLAPRVTMSAVKLKGYDIPAKTTVYINSWAMQRDPKFWESPEEFKPERFENIEVDFKGQEDFQFIPFGFGRRGCPGINFANASMEYMLANLLHWFDWKLPETDTQDIDMTEIFGLVVSKKVPLHVTPTTFSF